MVAYPVNKTQIKKWNRFNVSTARYLPARSLKYELQVWRETAAPAPLVIVTVVTGQAALLIN